MQSVNLAIVVSFECLVACFVSLVCYSSGLRITNFLFGVAFVIATLIAILLIMFLCVFGDGGSVIDVMKLMASVRDGGWATIVGVASEEILKFLLLCFFLRKVKDLNRSVNTIIMPGVVYGIVEAGIKANFLAATYVTFPTVEYIAIDAFGILIALLLHCLFMMVYGVNVFGSREMRMGFIVPLSVVMGLHYAYNMFVVPKLLDGLTLGGGMRSTLGFSSALLTVLLAIMLRRITAQSKIWKFGLNNWIFVRS